MFACVCVRLCLYKYMSQCFDSEFTTPSQPKRDTLVTLHINVSAATIIFYNLCRRRRVIAPHSSSYLLSLINKHHTHVYYYDEPLCNRWRGYSVRLKRARANKSHRSFIIYIRTYTYINNKSSHAVIKL